MNIDPKTQQASADIGAYILTHYGGSLGIFRAADSVCALGALAGVFAQVQARAMLMGGVLPYNSTALLDVETKDGSLYYFGEAINVALFEGAPGYPSFWNVAAGVARDPNIARAIDIEEIANRAAGTVGTPAFGRPKIDARYQLRETPFDAIRKHAVALKQRFSEIELDQGQLMFAFGLAAQGVTAIAAAEVPAVPVDMAMTRVDILRLLLESAVPMSKVDLRSLGPAR